MRILVVEDDVPLAKFIGKGLEEEHYAVDIVHDGEQARGMACESDYDLVILDLNLPGMDGISILQRLRDHKRLPVLILTGRTRLEDRIRALDLGADDCVLKPFSFAELSARVRALLRRGNTTHVDLKLRVADLELDRVQRTVARAGKRIELTSKEFALLEYLMRNAGRRVTRTMIIEHVWNLKFDCSSTTSREPSCWKVKSRLPWTSSSNRSHSLLPSVKPGNKCDPIN
jgi:two-component system copper resistance phosphate regulon response regulator CusR